MLLPSSGSTEKHTHTHLLHLLLPLRLHQSLLPPHSPRSPRPLDTRPAPHPGPRCLWRRVGPPRRRLRYSSAEHAAVRSAALRHTGLRCATVHHRSQPNPPAAAAAAAVPSANLRRLAATRAPARLPFKALALQGAAQAGGTHHRRLHMITHIKDVVQGRTSVFTVAPPVPRMHLCITHHLRVSPPRQLRTTAWQRGIRHTSSAPDRQAHDQHQMLTGIPSAPSAAAPAAGRRGSGGRARYRTRPAGGQGVGRTWCRQAAGGKSRVRRG